MTAHVRILCGVLLSVSSLASAQEFKSPEQAFLHLHSVAISPRCVNCHGKKLSDGRHVPTVGDNMQVHPMHVSSSIPQLGMNCTSCHQRKNFATPHLPPGAANDLMPSFLWHMPHESMIIPSTITPRELCAKWLNPESNGIEIKRGGRNDMVLFKKQFERHVEADPLLHWAFSPGPGRKSAPGTKEMFISAMKTWLSGDAPCP